MAHVIDQWESDVRYDRLKFLSVADSLYCTMRPLVFAVVALAARTDAIGRRTRQLSTVRIGAQSCVGSTRPRPVPKKLVYHHAPESFSADFVGDAACESSPGEHSKSTASPRKRTRRLRCVRPTVFEIARGGADDDDDDDDDDADDDDDSEDEEGEYELEDDDAVSESDFEGDTLQGRIVKSWSGTPASSLSPSPSRESGHVRATRPQSTRKRRPPWRVPPSSLLWLSVAEAAPFLFAS